MSTPFRILTVCIGNVCRSPLAERLLHVRLDHGYEVTSAGLRGLEGWGMEEHAAAELALRGGSPEGFVARRFQPEHATEAGLVLCATMKIRDKVIRMAPGALKRTFTVLEFALLAEQAPPEVEAPEQLVEWCAANRSAAAGEVLDVEDPMGMPPQVHRAVADELDRATSTIAAHLLRISGRN